MQYSRLFYFKTINRSIEWELRASELRAVIPHLHRCVWILCKQNVTCLRRQRWRLFLYILSSMVPKSSVMCAFPVWQFTPCIYALCVCMTYVYGHVSHAGMEVRGRPYGVNSPSHLHEGYNQTWVTRLAHYNVDLLSHLIGLNSFFFPKVLSYVCLEENEVAGWSVFPVDMVSASCSLLQCCLTLLILLHSSGFLFAHCLSPCTPVTRMEWPVVNRALGFRF